MWVWNSVCVHSEDTVSVCVCFNEIQSLWVCVDGVFLSRYLLYQLTLSQNCLLDKLATINLNAHFHLLVTLYRFTQLQENISAWNPTFGWMLLTYKYLTYLTVWQRWINNCVYYASRIEEIFLQDYLKITENTEEMSAK